MPTTKLTKLELQIMEALWTRGSCSVREIQETFPEQITASVEHLYDRTHKRVAAVKLVRFHDLVAARFRGADQRDRGGL